MLLVLQHIKSETQKSIPSAECDEIDETYTKFIAIPFISDALDWCCGDGCKFSHAHEGLMLILNNK